MSLADHVPPTCKHNPFAPDVLHAKVCALWVGMNLGVYRDLRTSEETYHIW